MRPVASSQSTLMREHLKNALAYGVGWKATAALLRERGLTVLMYHRIGASGGIFPCTDISQFREQMRWLKRHCRVIEPEEFDKVLASRGRPAVRPPVLVTFDDGYRDYHEHAYPVLQELRIPSIVFLATGHIDRGDLIWTDLITYAVRRSRRRELVLPWDPARRLTLDGVCQRLAFEQECKRFLKGASDRDRQRWQAEVLDMLGFDPAHAELERQMLSWEEVRAMTEFTRFGGHTHNHPILSRIDEAAAEEEIRLCRARIVEETGQEPRYFAYPNGRPCDFTESTKAALQRHGFELGFSTSPGIHRAGMDRFSIRRQPTGSRTPGDFAFLVAGR